MRRDRMLAVALGGLVAALAGFLLYQYGPHAWWLPGCLFQRLTGFLCPGCGMTRATHAALHGHLAEALRFNSVGLVLLPVALVGLGWQLPAWLRGQARPARMRRVGRWAWWLFGLLVVFWVLRNIPSWPFSLLAPP